MEADLSLSPQPNAAPTSVNSNSLILSEMLTDTSIPWQIHNCKIQQHIVTREQPLPFLYHYDSLSDALKETLPLTPALLAKFDTKMLRPPHCSVLIRH